MTNSLYDRFPERTEERIRKLEAGLPLSEIAKEEGISRQAVYEWVEKEGYLDVWRIKNTLYKKSQDIKRIYAKIGKCLNHHVQRLYEEALQHEETWPQAKAVEARFALKQKQSNALPLEKLQKIFENYIFYKQQGIKASYRKIGKGIANPNSTRIVMNRSNIEPLTYRHKK